MKKKLYKIKVWKEDCVLVQETDRVLTDDEAKNFNVAKKFRGTIEEVKKTTERTTKNILGKQV